MELEPADGSEDLHLVATDDGVLGNGTYGEVRLGVCQGQRVAVKSYSHDSSTAPEVPHHPGLVAVISRRVENGRTVEIRELCAQGELYDDIWALDIDGRGMARLEELAMKDVAGAVLDTRAAGDLHPGDSRARGV